MSDWSSESAESYAEKYGEWATKRQPEQGRLDG